MTEEQSPKPPPNYEAKYWSSRRRMAASAVMGMFATQIFTFLSPDMSSAQAELLSSSLWAYVMIVGGYMGFKMVEKGFGKK